MPPDPPEPDPPVPPDLPEPDPPEPDPAKRFRKKEWLVYNDVTKLVSRI